MRRRLFARVFAQRLFIAKLPSTVLFIRYVQEMVTNVV